MERETQSPLEDSHLQEIQGMLSAEGYEISLEQARMIANFIMEVGGLDQALHVLRELEHDRRAA